MKFKDLEDGSLFILKSEIDLPEGATVCLKLSGIEMFATSFNSDVRGNVFRGGKQIYDAMFEVPGFEINRNVQASKDLFVQVGENEKVILIQGDKIQAWKQDREIRNLESKLSELKERRK